MSVRVLADWSWFTIYRKTALLMVLAVAAAPVRAADPAVFQTITAEFKLQNRAGEIVSRRLGSVKRLRGRLALPSRMLSLMQPASDVVGCH